MSQSAAILLDAYRELNARKLFWITLGISGLVIAMYASLGFDDKGVFLFYGLWHIESEMLRDGSSLAQMLYRSIFSSFIVSVWLAWIATILALISTASIFPDMISSGSIDLILSKPIGRVRLFATKYVVSLLFVILQVGVFCLGAFICMGWRIGEWNWKIFLAIPLVTLFFSYLFCVSVLTGIVTRSTLAALLLTMLFWFTLFGGNLAYGILIQQRISTDVQLEQSHKRVEQLASRLSEVSVNLSESDPGAGERTQAQIDDELKAQDALKSANGTIRWWEKFVWWLQLPGPKTDETISLLDRWLKKDTDASMADLMSGNLSTDEQGRQHVRDRHNQREITKRIEAETDSQSTWYVLGTSLAFETFVLVLACAIFARRDY